MSEIIFTGVGDSATDRIVQARARKYAAMDERAARMDRSGEPLRKIYERVYTTNLRDSEEAIVQRNIWEILGTLFPGMVISARSAALMGLAKDAPGGPGFVFLTGSYRRGFSLPGVEIRVTEGPGKLPGDFDFMGLSVASPARQCLENLMPSRARGGIARSTGRKAVEEYLLRRCQVAGEESLNEIRDNARQLKETLGAGAQFEELNGIIGALLKSRTATDLVTENARSMAAGGAFDPECVDRLNLLFSYLASTPMPTREDHGIGTEAFTNTAFIEAYFSNYIEGTEFLIGEAEDIVFNGVIPQHRPLDGHDILSTFNILSDVSAMKAIPKDFDSFVGLIRNRHKNLMGHRTDLDAGEFKTTLNRAGNTVFVHPQRVMGTLRRGFEMLEGLTHPLARGAFLHYLVSEVHPFSDGNGRLSRIMLASELTVGGLSRVVIPTVFRDDYLGGQRALSRHNDPEPNFRMLNRAQEVTAQIVESDRERCIARWASTHAFVEASRDAQLTQPTDGSDVVFHKGVPGPKDYWEAQSAPSAGIGI